MLSYYIRLKHVQLKMDEERRKLLQEMKALRELLSNQLDEKDREIALLNIQHSDYLSQKQELIDSLITEKQNLKNHQKSLSKKFEREKRDLQRELDRVGKQNDSLKENLVEMTSARQQQGGVVNLDECLMMSIIQQQQVVLFKLQNFIVLLIYDIPKYFYNYRAVFATMTLEDAFRGVLLSRHLEVR